MDPRWLSPFGLQPLTAEETKTFGRRALVLGLALGAIGAPVLGWAHHAVGAVPLAVVYVAAAATVAGAVYVMRGLERLVLGPPSGTTGDAAARVAYGWILRAAVVLVVVAALAVVRETP